MDVSAPVFRPATDTDVPALVALVESAYRGETSRAGWTTEADLLDGQRTDAEAVRELLHDPGSLLLTAEHQGDLAACCHVSRQGGDVAEFGMFAVSPKAQGAGLGRALLAEAEHRAVAAWGTGTMTMKVISQRTDLIAWYLRRGYAPTGDRRPFPYGDERFGLPRRDDLDFTVLAKPLT